MIPTMVGITFLAYAVSSQARTSKFKEQESAMFGFQDAQTGAEGASGGGTVSLVNKYPDYEQVETLIKRFEFDIPIMFNGDVLDRDEKIIKSFEVLSADIPSLDLKSVVKEAVAIKDQMTEKELVVWKKLEDRLKDYIAESDKTTHKWSYEEAFKNEVAGLIASITETKVVSLKKEWDAVQLELDARSQYRKDRDVARRHLEKFKTLVNPVVASTLVKRDEKFKAFVFEYLNKTLKIKNYSNEKEFLAYWEKNKSQYEEQTLREIVSKYLSYENVDENAEAIKLYAEFEDKAKLYVPIFFSMYEDYNDYSKKLTLVELFEKFSECPDLSYFDQVTAENLVTLRRESVYWYRNKDEYVNYEVLGSSGKFRCFFLMTSYGRWLRDVLQFNFRNSESLSKPVLECIKERMPISIRFGLIGFILSYTVCIPLGMLKALKHRSNFDFYSSFLVFLGYSIPGWALGIVLLVLFGGGSTDLQWFPIKGVHTIGPEYEQMTMMQQFWDNVHHAVLPVISYMVGSFATITMLMKNSLMENLGADYIRTAFSKGLSEKRVILIHGMRNSLIPLCTGLGHMLSLVIAGSYLIEKAFDIQGFGLMGFNAIMNYDINLLMGVLLFASILKLWGNLFSDILYSIVDPRVRFK